MTRALVGRLGFGWVPCAIKVRLAKTTNAKETAILTAPTRMGRVFAGANHRSGKKYLATYPSRIQPKASKGGGAIIRARSGVAFMTREKTAWCNQRGVTHIKITLALLAQPGTTLMRPAWSA